MLKKDLTILEGLNMSLLTEDERAALYLLLEKYNVRHTQVTPSQQMLITGISRERAARLTDELATLFPIRPGYRVSSIHACPAIDQCRYATGNAVHLGRRINDLRFDAPFPHKVKVAVAGCNMCCTQPYLRDVGLLAKARGWTVLFGGNGGGRPRIADVLAENLTDDEAVVLVKKALDVYRRLGSPKQRTARFIERVGFESFLESIDGNIDHQ